MTDTCRGCGKEFVAIDEQVFTPEQLEEMREAAAMTRGESE